MHVALGHKLLARLQVDVLETPRQINALSLAHIDRLHDERLSLLLVELGLEVVLVRWQHPRFGEEVELILESFLHAGQVSRQIVLSCKRLHTRLAVDALVGSELADLFGLDADVGPVEVPVGVDVLVELEVHFAAHPLYHIVPRRVRAQNELLIGLLLRHLRWRRLSHVVFFVVR